MKKTNIILIGLVIFFLVFIIILVYKEDVFSPRIKTGEEQDAKTELKKEQMKVRFYIFDIEKGEKGDFLGKAELKDDSLDINVTDLKLRQILESPYTTIAGEKKDDILYTFEVTYQPATFEHLHAIAIECWRFGYLSEIERK